jgi:hypothetical protein
MCPSFPADRINFLPLHIRVVVATHLAAFDFYGTSSEPGELVGPARDPLLLLLELLLLLGLLLALLFLLLLLLLLLRFWNGGGKVKQES